MTAVICAKLRFGITIAAMRLLSKTTVVIALTAIGLCNTFAQDDPDDSGSLDITLQTVAARQSKRAPSITPDDRLSLLAAALDAHVQQAAEPDCSHLVHAIYEAAGLPYSYAPSSDLYAGVESFERVKTPSPGDLVVWRGHVGIVTEPSHHVFFSYLSSGPGTDDYETAYWKRRGHPRFYRYVKKELARRDNY